MPRKFIGILLVVLMLGGCTPASDGLQSLSMPAVTETAVPVDPGLPRADAPQIVSLSMFGEQGWAVALDARLLRTFDGARSWYDVTPPDWQGYSLYPCYLDADHAWFTLMDVTRSGPSGYPAGIVYRTADGGRTWQSFPVEFNGALFFLDAFTGYALADLGAGAGSQYVAVYRTSDGGATWTQVFSHQPGVESALPAGGLKSGLVFSDPYNGWIGGNIPMENSLYYFRSRDGGVSWSPVDLPLPAGVDSAFYEVQPPVFFSPSTGILPVRMLALDGTPGFVFYRTQDGGETWAPGTPLAGGLDYGFLSVGQGWAVSATTLYFTNDGGLTWSATAAAPAGTQFLRVEPTWQEVVLALTVVAPDSLGGLAVQRLDAAGSLWEQVAP